MSLIQCQSRDCDIWGYAGNLRVFSGRTTEEIYQAKMEIRVQTTKTITVQSVNVAS